jgi:hypothetical protein
MEVLVHKARPAITHTANAGPEKMPQAATTASLHIALAIPEQIVVQAF